MKRKREAAFVPPKENTVGLSESANDNNEIADMTKSLKIYVAVIVSHLTYFVNACSF